MEKETIVLVGGGGHCRACIDVIEQCGCFDIAGIVDTEENKGRRIMGYEVIASDDDLPALAEKYGNFLITIGQIKSAGKRKEKYEALKGLGARFPVVVSPQAYVSPHARIGEGTIVMHRACVNALVTIEENCIINTGACIEHDTVIGRHCHVSTQSVINGGCRIGGESFIGSNSVINNNLQVGDAVIVASGAVVISSLEQPGIYAGNPAGKKEK